PGGGLVGGEAAVPYAAHDPQVVGDGDVPPVGGHIGEGGAVAAGRPRQGGVAQGPDQHDRHLLTGDVVRGAEGAAGGGHRAVCQGGLHGGVEPPVGLHVGEGGRAGGDLVPAEQPHQGGDKSGPGDGLSPAEEAVADALE